MGWIVDVLSELSTEPRILLGSAGISSDDVGRFERTWIARAPLEPFLQTLPPWQNTLHNRDGYARRWIRNLSTLELDIWKGACGVSNSSTKRGYSII